VFRGRCRRDTHGGSFGLPIHQANEETNCDFCGRQRPRIGRDSEYRRLGKNEVSPIPMRAGAFSDGSFPPGIASPPKAREARVRPDLGQEIQIRSRVTPRGRGRSLVSRFVIVPAVYGLGFCAYNRHPL
jgi:hypothetical protein